MDNSQQNRNTISTNKHSVSGLECAQCASSTKPSLLVRTETSIVISVALFLAGFAAARWISMAYLQYLLFGTAYILMGHRVVLTAVRNLLHGKVFDENFLMTIATFGAIAIGEIPEAVGVMLFYTVGDYFQDRAVDKSRSSITALLDLRPTSARRITATGPEEVRAEEIQIGDKILVYAGEHIPVDGEVVEGSSYVDTAALTGESVPRSVDAGDEVLGGYVNGESTLTVKTVMPADDSAVARVLHMVEDAAGRKAPTERFMSRFARYYTPVVVGLALVVAFIPPLLVSGQDLAVWGYRALILLVISCPCALVVSVPLGYFGGVGAAARAGLLVKGAEYLDRLLKTKIIAFDKTGTITKGNFTVTQIVPRNGNTPAELLKWTAAGEQQSRHPVAEAIRSAGAQHSLDAEAIVISEYSESKGYGVICTVNDRQVVTGSDRLMHREQIPHQDCDIEGTVVYVALDGGYLGYILIADEIKPEAQDTVRQLKAMGVEKLVMLTGDDQSAARQVARKTDIDHFFSQLLPEDKLRQVEILKNNAPREHSVMFVGDGINDAPVLTTADVGVAMGGLGSDAAVEAADIVLMKDDLRALPKGIRIARSTRKIVIQNIVGALGVKAVVMIFGIAGFATMWAAVFADVGVALLAVANSMRIITAFRKENSEAV